MHIKDLEKIAKEITAVVTAVEFYNEHKEEIDAINKEVEKLEKEEAPQREMTVAEIEKELGYKVKVIGGPYDKREK